jgi:hypothetical protein
MFSRFVDLMSKTMIKMLQDFLYNRKANLYLKILDILINEYKKA